jgi:hypothetical protein
VIDSLRREKVMNRTHRLSMVIFVQLLALSYLEILSSRGWKSMLQSRWIDKKGDQSSAYGKEIY